jgi:hypothetical protein
MSESLENYFQQNKNSFSKFVKTILLEIFPDVDEEFNVKYIIKEEDRKRCSDTLKSNVESYSINKIIQTEKNEDEVVKVVKKFLNSNFFREDLIWVKFVLARETSFG